MTRELRDCVVLTNATELGFNIDQCLSTMHPAIFEFAATLEIREVYPHLHEKVIQYAETYICEYQVSPFVKEVYHNLHYKRSFGFVLPSGLSMDVDDFNSPHGLIDWEKHKDCKDDDKIFFFSCLDLDCKTVYVIQRYAGLGWWTLSGCA
jgi:hypothetical protein